MIFLSKKKLLSLSILVVLVAVFGDFFLRSGVCKVSLWTWCREVKEIINMFISFSFVFFFIFPLSLLTYKMRDEVFEHWMRFAIWTAPVVIIAHILMYAVFYRNGSPDVFEKIVVVPIFILIYGIFVLISLWRIVARWRELKRGVGELN